MEEDIEFIGRRYTQTKNGATPKSVQKALTIERPPNKDLLKSCLAAWRWLDRYMYGFAEISHALAILERNDEPYRWEFEQEMAFQSIKKALESIHLLSNPRPTGKYVLKSDASCKAISGTLFQEQWDRHQYRLYSKIMLGMLAPFMK